MDTLNHTFNNFTIGDSNKITDAINGFTLDLASIKIWQFKDFNVRNYMIMQHFMYVNINEFYRRNLMSGTGVPMYGNSENISNEVIPLSYTEPIDYTNFARFIPLDERNGIATTRLTTQRGDKIDLFPDDNDFGTFDNKWEVENPNVHNSILRKTKQAFRNRQINTLISRFSTNADANSNNVIGKHDAQTLYGDSHGRNLLKKSAERNPGKETYNINGYNNPYCRVWTHHYQMDNLSKAMRPFVELDDNGKYDGKTVTPKSLHNWGDMFKPDDKKKWGWKTGLENWDKSVLDKKTGLLNIAPSYVHGGDSNIHPKQCMFSIENLAWKDYDPYTFEQTLSWEQRGPNGGRIMWFPPYNLTVQETARAEWNQQAFIGRGEKVYTYTNSERTANISFTLLIDHPSTIDYATWYDNTETTDNDLHRYFAGCDSADPNDPDSLLSKVRPTPLTDEYQKVTGAPLQVEEKTKLVPQEPSEELSKISFYVFFPNNYSGCYDMPKHSGLKEGSSKVNAISYLLSGIGAQKDYKANSNDLFMDYVTPNIGDYKDVGKGKVSEKIGYEIVKDKPISLEEPMESPSETLEMIGYKVYIIHEYYDVDDIVAYSTCDSKISDLYKIEDFSKAEEEFKNSKVSEEMAFRWVKEDIKNDTRRSFVVEKLNDNPNKYGKYVRIIIDLADVYKMGDQEVVPTNGNENEKTIGYIVFTQTETYLGDDVDKCDLQSGLFKNYSDAFKYYTKEYYRVKDLLWWDEKDIMEEGEDNIFIRKMYSNDENTTISIFVHEVKESEIVKTNNFIVTHFPGSNDSHWTMKNGKYQKKGNRLFYRTDGFYEYPKTQDDKLSNTWGQVFELGKNGGKDSYYDTKSYGLNSDCSQIIGDGRLETKENEENVFSFTDVACAFSKMKKWGEDTTLYLENVSNKDKVENLIEKFENLEVEKVEIKGFSNSHGKQVSQGNKRNDKLAKNRAETIKLWLNEINKDWDIKTDVKSNVNVKNRSLESLEAKQYRSVKCDIFFKKTVQKPAIEMKIEPTQEDLESVDTLNYNGFFFSHKNGDGIDMYLKKGDDTGEFWYKENGQMKKVHQRNNLTEFNTETIAKQMEDKNSSGEYNRLRYDQEYHFFKKLQNDKPKVWEKLMEKIKFFNPAFHSMTPEGFNARLTFLNQCTRQGSTLSMSDKNGSTANNLAFGRPPFCVLRIGDFYNQMIIINSIDFDYNQDTTPLWDLNEEGAGVQPLICRVNMQVTLLGGGDLAGPVRRLQNANSFNYYANTSLYDNRADRPQYDFDYSTNIGELNKEESYSYTQKNKKKEEN